MTTTQDVYVRYTEADHSANPPIPASIDYYTDQKGTDTWNPSGPAYGHQITYKFYHAANSHSFGWYAFDFWPENSDSEPLATVVESFRYPHNAQKAYYQSTLYVQNIDLGSNNPSFCVCNNNDSGEKMYLGLQVTICARQSGDYYLTSKDPKIPLEPNT